MRQRSLPIPARRTDMPISGVRLPETGSSREAHNAPAASCAIGLPERSSVAGVEWARREGRM
jgi:hypothetical protein